MQEYTNADVVTRTWPRLKRADGRTLELAPGEVTDGGVWCWTVVYNEDGTVESRSIEPLGADVVVPYLVPAGPKLAVPAPPAVVVSKPTEPPKGATPPAEAAITAENPKE